MAGTVFVKNAAIRKRNKVRQMEDLKKYLYLGKRCNRCGRIYSRADQEFYSSHRLTTKIELNTCKYCIKEMYEVNNIEQAKIILQALDMPFIKKEWDRLNDTYKNLNILGRYIAKMNLRGFLRLYL